MASADNTTLSPAGKPISSFTLFTKSKDAVLKNLKTFGILYILPFLISLAGITTNSDGNIAGSPNFGGASISPSVIGLGLLFSVVALVVYIIVTVMLYALNLETADGKRPELDDLWPYVKKFGWRIVLLSIAITFLIILGLLALIVPGLIFIRRYYLAPYALIDKDLSVGEAMKESARLSKPFSGSVWGIIGVTILLSLPGVIPIFGWLISFVLGVLYTAAPAMRYLELKKLSA